MLTPQCRWSTELKLSILQEAFSADGTVLDIARGHEVLPQQIYAWRKKLCRALTDDGCMLAIPVMPARYAR
ncbi:transposase [Rhizobium mesosinicum]